jgi:hypothetical protein
MVENEQLEPMQQVFKLIAKWRKQALDSREEAGRIRRTVMVATDAEANCYIRAELWDKNAEELERVNAADIDTGWLIERLGANGPEWLIAWSGGFDWTTDSLKAIRFCRREDANQVAEIFESEDVHICEHQWG